MRFYADDALNKTDWNKNLEEERWKYMIETQEI
jgi:hypothetical protein